MELTFRFAQEADTPLILRFIRDLAEYEHMADQVVADEATLKEQLFDRRGAEVLFALFFHNFSTFLGRAGLYLEDLYVLPEHRGKGYGKAIFRRLASIARQRGCGRMEWWSWTGMPPASPFTAPWAPGPWTSGRYTASPERIWSAWRSRKAARIN